MTTEGSTQFVNFMTTGAGVLVLGHKVKIHYSSLLPCIVQQTKYIHIVMMTKKGSTKIVTFMTQGAGDLVLKCGHISLIVEMHFFSKNLLFYS